jgi:hypothetical protein
MYARACSPTPFLARHSAPMTLQPAAPPRALNLGPPPVGQVSDVLAGLGTRSF